MVMVMMMLLLLTTSRSLKTISAKKPNLSHPVYLQACCLQLYQYFISEIIDNSVIICVTLNISDLGPEEKTDWLVPRDGL